MSSLFKFGLRMGTGGMLGKKKKKKDETPKPAEPTDPFLRTNSTNLLGRGAGTPPNVLAPR